MGEFVKTAVGEAGRLDVSFDLISVGDVQGTPLAEMEWVEFIRPIETAVRTNFLTVKAAASRWRCTRSRRCVASTRASSGAWGCAS